MLQLKLGGSCVNELDSLIPYSHRVGGNGKRSSQLTNSDKKSIETVFSIVICRQLGDK